MPRKRWLQTNLCDTGANEGAEPPRARRTRDDATISPVPDSEMETETDMEVTAIDYNDITSASHPERDAEDRKQCELELAGKRERIDREMAERLASPGCIICKKCKDIVTVTMARCPR